MEPQEIYNTMEQAKRLENVVLNKKKVSDDDQDVTDYNDLIDSIKQLSVSDIKAYHNFMCNKVNNDTSKKKVDDMLDKFKQSFNPQTYGNIEQIVRTTL